MAITKNTKIVLIGRGPMTIRPSDHVATGGEGSVYLAGKTVVKIFTDPHKKMFGENKLERIERLSSFDHPYIVAPKGLVTDSRDKPIGYYMDYVNGDTISRTFTNQFRTQENFDDKDAATLAARMREAVEFAHANNAVIVDGNELNHMVTIGKSSGPTPHMIDVDSWVVDNKWPKSVAVMPSIRDWHTKGWNELSDWFAWGVVSFRVFTGTHPYKGKLAGYKPADMERRMKENASVFTPEAFSNLPSAVRDFSCISGPLLDWYQATFQEGERSIPPSPFEVGTAVTSTNRVKRVVTTAAGALDYNKLYGETGNPAIRVLHCGIVLLENGNLVDLKTQRVIGTAKSPKCEIVKTDKGWLLADWENAKPVFHYINGVNSQVEQLNLNLSLLNFVAYENRLFAITDKGLIELHLKHFAKSLLVTGNTYGVSANSTKWFDGLGVMDALGAMYLITVFDESSSAKVRVPELDGLKVINAKAGHRFVTVVAVDKNGDYQKLEFTFNNTYKSYTLWKGTTDSADLNIAILPKQVCATIVSDGELNIFVPKNGAMKKVPDKHISTDMALANWEDTVVYIHDGAVWSLKLK